MLILVMLNIMTVYHVVVVVMEYVVYYCLYCYCYYYYHYEVVVDEILFLIDIMIQYYFHGNCQKMDYVVVVVGLVFWNWHLVVELMKSHDWLNHWLNCYPIEIKMFFLSFSIGKLYFRGIISQISFHCKLY